MVMFGSKPPPPPAPHEYLMGLIGEGSAASPKRPEEPKEKKLAPPPGYAMRSALIQLSAIVSLIASVAYLLSLLWVST